MLEAQNTGFSWREKMKQTCGSGACLCVTSLNGK